MKVRDLMSPNPYCIQANEAAQRAAQLMRQHAVGALPVCEDETLVGIITDRDIAIECTAAGKAPDQCLVREAMTTNPTCIRPDAGAEEALQIMAREQVRRLCVTDNGHILGMISLGDCAVKMPDNPAVARALAEISVPVRAGQLVGAGR